ncbi:hypothetical protein DY000_02033537 [Brassica cretica]|uniref:Chromo domain-containing protein n=1 Tax=Brassica cretica TaxID=69181 RepID=A0ABQ7DFB5_BRACR|nr:hypothetical protein DY000_02033537 [Brassica cretica]
MRDNVVLKLHPEAVLQERVNIRDNTKEILVRWSGLHADEATWESSEQIKASFPEFVQKLEDKLQLQQGSIDEEDDVQDVRVGGRKSSRERRPNPRYHD